MTISKKDLKRNVVKPLFRFLENPFLVNVLENGDSIITNMADLEIEFLE